MCLIAALTPLGKPISSTQFGLTVKNKRERPTRETWLASSGSPGVFSCTQPRWPYCVSKQIEWLALWQASLCGVQIHRVSTTVLLHSQVTACSRQQGALVVFTQLLDGKRAISLLAVNWKKQETLIVLPLDFTRCRSSVSNPISYVVTKSCWAQVVHYLYSHNR